MPSDCVSPGPRRTRTTGIGDAITANTDGTFAGARRALGLSSLTGTEMAVARQPLDNLRNQGLISDSYYRRARAQFERDPDALVHPYAPGVLSPLLGQPLAPSALRDFALGVVPQPIGPSLREGCACTPREFDARDPVSGWGIYYVNGGVLLTPSLKCIGGGGRPPGFLATIWRNTVALFKTPTNIAPAPPPPLPAIDYTPGAPPPPPPPPTEPCVPDIIVGRDEGMFASGWWIVLRNGQRILVANPKTCP